MTDPLTYLDHAASTPLRVEAFDAMRPYLSEHPGNPSGSHAAARAAKTALEEAREAVAGVLGCMPDEVVFTGGGTEADNLALKGGARAARRVDGLDGVVTTAFEHKGVLAAAHRLESEGFRVTMAGVTAEGIVDLDDLAACVDERTAVVSVMGVNNEVGTIQPLPAVAALVRGRAPRRAAAHRRGAGGAVGRCRDVLGRLRPRRDLGAQVRWPEGDGGARGPARDGARP